MECWSSRVLDCWSEVMVERKDRPKLLLSLPNVIQEGFCYALGTGLICWNNTSKKLPERAVALSALRGLQIQQPR